MVLRQENTDHRNFVTINGSNNLKNIIKHYKNCGYKLILVCDHICKAFCIILL